MMMDGVNNEDIQTSNDPASIEDAMRMLRQDNQQDAGSSVGDSSMEQSEGAAGSEQVQEESPAQGQEGTEYGSSIQGQDQSNVSDGGPADTGQVSQEPTDSLEDIDYREVSKAYIQSTQRLAIDAANKLFRDNNISKVTINDLYSKDERGRVSFNNPDDPDRPFQSRAEAQQWCDAFNAQVDSEWRRTVQNNQRGYMQDIQPMLRLMDFAPEFNSMSKKEQGVFDNIVEQYAIKDRTGMTIGYSCDLHNAKRVAMNICSAHLSDDDSKQQQSTSPGSDQKIQGGGPAVDAKTSGTGNPQNDIKDPKNIEEAMKLIAASKKEKK